MNTSLTGSLVHKIFAQAQVGMVGVLHIFGIIQIFKNSKKFVLIHHKFAGTIPPYQRSLPTLCTTDSYNARDPYLPSEAIETFSGRYYQATNAHTSLVQLYSNSITFIPRYHSMAFVSFSLVFSKGIGTMYQNSCR